MQTGTTLSAAEQGRSISSYSESIPLEGREDTRKPRRQAACLFVAAALLLVAAIELGAAVTWPSASSRYPRFLVIGDWGRDGQYNQTLVAEAMARYAEKYPVDFVISTGDNFYESGLVSVDDPSFDTSFTQIYNQPSLQDIPWHVALGNHDYGEVDNPQDDPKCPKDSTADCFYSPLHQLDVRLSHRDSRWHCERSFSVKLANGDVEIFFLDTTPINDNYHSKVWASNRAGIFEQSWEAQVAELGSKLKQSQARWKFVVGHHPIRSNHRADLLYPDMVQRVEPLLLQYKVSAYFAGHDHNLQFRKQGGLVPYAQIVSGAGSAIGKGFYSDEDAPFQATVNGFAAVEMAGELTKVEYYGLDSDEPLFVGEVRKPQF